MRIFLDAVLFRPPLYVDVLRRKRNLSDYTGEDIDEGSVEACRAGAKRLLGEVEAWLKKQRSLGG